MTQTECSLDNSCAFDAATQACREATFAESAEAMWTQFAQYASLGEAALEAGKGVFLEWTRNEDPWNTVDLSRSADRANSNHDEVITKEEFVTFFTFRIQQLVGESSTGNKLRCNPKWEEFKGYTAEEKAAAWTRCNALGTELSYESGSICGADQTCEFNYKQGFAEEMQWINGMKTLVEHMGVPAGTTELTKDQLMLLA